MPTEPHKQTVFQPKIVENPVSIDDTKLAEQLANYDVLGIVTPEYNCCVQKVIGEMAPYLKGGHGIAPVMAFDPDPKKIIESIPDWIMYLRAGVKQGEPIPYLAMLDAHIPVFRGLGLEVYYYLDDALFFINNMAPLKLMWSCDKIIVATDALAEFLIENQKMPKPIYMLKTHMDLPSFDRCTVPLYLIDQKKFNILFTSQGRIGALMLRRILEEMNKTPTKYANVNMIIVSAWVGQMRTIVNEFRGIKKTYWEWMPLLEHYGLTKAVQLIIAPGEEGDLEGQVEPELQHIWIHAKSCLKYTLAGAARKPVIASPMNEYEKSIKNGETGFLANTLKEWMEYIDLCINDKDLCQKIGEAARKDVEQNWHIKDRARQFAEIFRGSNECLVQGIDHAVKEETIPI